MEDVIDTSVFHSKCDHENFPLRQLKTLLIPSTQAAIMNPVDTLAVEAITHTTHVFINLLFAITGTHLSWDRLHV